MSRGKTQLPLIPLSPLTLKAESLVPLITQSHHRHSRALQADPPHLPTVRRTLEDKNVLQDQQANLTQTFSNLSQLPWTHFEAEKIAREIALVNSELWAEVLKDFERNLAVSSIVKGVLPTPSNSKDNGADGKTSNGGLDFLDSDYGSTASGLDLKYLPKAVRRFLDFQRLP
jgi:hypothetical protein